MTGTTDRATDDLKLLQTAPGIFGYSVKQITAACLLSGLVAGAFSALTSETAAENGPTSSVNRVNKADRLTPAQGAQLPRHGPGLAPELRASGPMPVGCERAFSPIVSPAHADIVRDCLT